MIPSCTSAVCYLSQFGGKVTFPLITVAGLVDGINPCAIGMILLLLGYIIIFAKKPERVLILGGIYILTVYLTYLTIGLFFYRSINFINLTLYKPFFETGIGSVLILAGLINIKDFITPNLPIHLEIPKNVKPKLLKLVEQVSIPSTITLGILVTLLETPCSLPIYIGTASILSSSNLSLPLVLLYFLYYNFLFVLPLLVILVLVWRGKEIVSLKEWQHKGQKWMKLGIGMLLVLMGVWLFL